MRAQVLTRFNKTKYRVSLSPAGNAMLLSFLSSRKLSVLSGFLSQYVLVRVVDTEDPVYVASHGSGEESARRCAPPPRITFCPAPRTHPARVQVHG